MIKFRVNGKIFELENDINVYDFLAQNGYELKFIALGEMEKFCQKSFGVSAS